MDTFLSRANQLFAFATTMLAVLSALCWASGQFLLPRGDPNLVFEAKNLVLTNGYEARGIRTESHKLDMRMALQADVSSLFNWSVKEVFLMLMAEYDSKKNGRNEVVVWDRVVMHDDPDSHRISIKNGRNKYDFFDDGKYLRGHENVTFSLHWNVVNFAGTLPQYASGHTVVPMPAVIGSAKKSK